MESEPFIMKTVDRAREWVDAYSASTQIDKEESAKVLAMLCGFGSWEVMIFAIESMPPTACDETVGEDVFGHRKDRYMHVFICLLNIRPAIAMFFIRRLSPSASYQFEPFAMEDALGNEAKLREQFLTDEAEFLQDDDENVTDPVRLMTGARLCGRVNVDGWIDGLDYLGWEVDHESIDEAADNGEPSFDVYDEDIGLIPVYLSCLTRIPETEDDPSIRLFMKACLGDFIMDNGSDGESRNFFMILWSHPQHKEIGGKDYCCIGVSYSSMSESWKELLISTHCESLEHALQLNDLIHSIDDLEGDEGCEDLVDENRDLSCALTIILAGNSPLDEPEGGWEIICETDTETGWSRLRIPELDETPAE